MSAARVANSRPGDVWISFNDVMPWLPTTKLRFGAVITAMQSDTSRQNPASCSLACG